MWTNLANLNFKQKLQFHFQKWPHRFDTNTQKLTKLNSKHMKLHLSYKI